MTAPALPPRQALVDAPFPRFSTMMIQPNVTTRDRKAGVQTGEMVPITPSEIMERLHQVRRGFVRI